MPGYLSHLAARVSGIKSTVRPRVPSIFESAPNIASLATPDTGTLRVVDRERIVPQPSVARPTSATTETPLHAQTNFRPASLERQPTPQISHRDEPPNDAPPLDHLTPPSRPRREPRPDFTAEDTNATPREPVPSRNDQPAHGSLDQSHTITQQPTTKSPRVEAQPPAAPLTTLESQTIRNIHEESRTERKPIEPESTRVPQPPPQAITVTPQIETRPAERFPTFPEPHEPERPSVQVTIGRLIVEAVAPAPVTTPLPAPRPQAPRLSLDDYLRQRRSQA